MENGCKKTTIIGLGRSGVKVIGKLHEAGLPGSINLLAFDTDEATLNASPLPDENKITADEKWRNGAGTGGDVVKGQRSMARERGRIEELLKDSDLLILTGGLGGGTGTGGAPAFAGVAKKLKINSIFVMTMPFSMEGHSKRRIAEDGIRELLPLADVLLCLPNDLLFSCLPGDTHVEEAFVKADLEVARTIRGIYEMMRQGNLLPTDFADLKDILSKKKSFCSIGVGTASASDGLNRCHLALERMLDSPLLGGTTKINEADAVIISLTGGSDLKIDETRKALDAFQKFAPENARTVIGANTDPMYNEDVQITAIAVNFDKSKTSESLGARNDSFGLEQSTIIPQKRIQPELDSGDLEQGELPLQNLSRGIFLNSMPVNINGEDLDIPTFQRKMIIIDKGK
ncbi:hypothetical protein P0136_10825 [Lentisphaerota bacterium ZTH]|nr:hypothetical protein JYG24_11655 [Lentisphaerota bacterium]WET05855.1 hypothetical protein P0136_10825 [Lentisphaerota bacterium ZTH]